MSQRDPIREKLYPYQRGLYDKLMGGEIDLANLVIPKNIGKLTIGVDLATAGCDFGAVAVRQGSRFLLSAGAGQEATIDRDWINGLNAGRKADREQLALALDAIAQAHGATVKRRDEEPNPGYRGCSIHLAFALGGVGAMVNIDNLHGGRHGLVHWYNDYDERRQTRNFAGRFRAVIRAFGGGSSHKATSGGDDWHALAMSIDRGLCLAAAGEAFEQPSAS